MYVFSVSDPAPHRMYDWQPQRVDGDGKRYTFQETPYWGGDDYDFEQPRMMWLKAFDDSQRRNTIYNVSEYLKHAKRELRVAQCAIFYKVHIQLLMDIFL